MVNDAILDGEIEYRRQFLAKQNGQEADFTEAFNHLRRGVDLSLNLAYNEPWGQMQPVRHILGSFTSRARRSRGSRRGISCRYRSLER